MDELNQKESSPQGDTSYTPSTHINKKIIYTLLISLTFPQIVFADIQFSYLERVYFLALEAIVWPFELFDFLLLVLPKTEVGNVVFFIIVVIVELFIYLGIPYLLGRHLDKRMGRLHLNKMRGFRFQFILPYLFIILFGLNLIYYFN